VDDSNVPKKMTDNTEKRLRKLAFAKSKLELVLRMMTRLSQTSGLENVIRNGLEAIMEAVGATNIVLLYRHGSNYVCVDVFGNNIEKEDLKNSEIFRVYKDKIPRTVSSHYHNTKMTFQTKDSKSYTWIYPLLSRNEALGVIKVENTIYGTQGYDDALELFFSYFAQQLKNELHNTEKLQQINNQLERLNRELEKRVQQRTCELESSNKRLKKSEDKYRMLVENQTDMVVKVDLDGKFLFVSPSYCKMFGKSREDLLGKQFLPLVHEDDRDSTIEAMKALHVAPYSTYMEQRAITSQGWRWIAWSDSAVLDNDGNVEGIIGVGRDITKQKEAERALLKSEEKYRSILESMSDAAYISSHDYYIEYMNPKMIQQTGYDACGEKCYQAIHHLDKKCPWCVMDEIQQGKITEYELDSGRDDRLYSISNSPVHNSDGTVSKLSIFKDVTEAKTIEDQLRQAQKMESVGRLAGGVAHDFNNMLSVILGNTEMIMEEHYPGSPFLENLKEIKDAAERSTDLVRQLLAFARKQTVSPQILDLNKTMAGMLKMLQRLIGENIVLKWLPAATLWPVKIDPSQIDQILANLCVNSRDAITSQGKIIIETLNVTLDEKDCKKKTAFNSGDYAMISFSDNGCGMDKGTLDNLFEPFFTTKDVGQGTGLGLATVYGIVKQNNGCIDVISEQGHGTTFKIYFPRFNQEAAPQDKTAEMTIEKGNETILLVEDEKAILRMTSMMLERIGYQVIPAHSPGEAVQIAENLQGKEIHLLMTDVIMPEMNGWDLSKKLLPKFPHLKCLFMSGYTADVIADHVIDEDIEFINKPFSKNDLAVKLRSILDESK